MAGEIERSGRSSRTAIDLLTALADEYPDRPDYRGELARHYVFYGHSRVLNGDFPSGLEAYEKAAALCDALMKEEPDQPAHRRAAAEARRSLGYFYTRMSPAQAEGHFRAAVAATEGLPDTAEDRVLTANVLGAYGAFLVSQRRMPEGEKTLRQGLVLLDKPLPTRGMGRMAADMAAITLRTTLALLCFQTRRPEEGDRFLATVIANLETQSGDVPQTFPYRLQAVTAYQLAGQRRERAGDLVGAVAASAKALAVCDALLVDVPTLRELPKGIWFQQIRLTAAVDHASRLARTGQRAEAPQTDRRGGSSGGSGRHQGVRRGLCPGPSGREGRPRGPRGPLPAGDGLVVESVVERVSGEPDRDRTRPREGHGHGGPSRPTGFQGMGGGAREEVKTGVRGQGTGVRSQQTALCLC